MPVSRQQLLAHQICHSRQQPNVGCIQHSFYALTGAADILLNQNDGSEYRFLLRAQYLGYLLWPLYCNQFAAADQAFWRQFRDKAVNGREWEYRLLVTIQPGPQQHVFGMSANFHRDNLIVSDPMQNALAPMGFQEFLNRQIPGTQFYYHHALEVLSVDSGEPNDYR
jgi:hypothetical protein